MPAIAPERVSALFEAGGTEQIVGGNTPFLLDDPSSVWLVASGKIEVFSVQVEAGSPKGTRHHFLTAAEGDALFGIDSARDGEGLGLLAVGMVGTRLLRLEVGRLRESSGDGPLAVEIAGLIERWVTGLSRGVARFVPQPRAEVGIGSGKEASLADGQRARGQKGVVWVRTASARLLFMGIEEIEPDASAVFPVTPDTFVQALADVTLTGVDTAGALQCGEVWAGLEHFYHTLFKCQFLNTRLAAVDERNRLRQKFQRDATRTAASLADLASVLEPPAADFADADSADPLLAACTVVGRRLGITFQAPIKPADGESPKPTVQEIVKASRVRSRQVVLKGQWWTEDTWPLLAFLDDGRHPVALLPAGSGRFDLYDPASRRRARVTKDVAASLSPVAHSFYRPFPQRALSPLDLLRFAIEDNGRDLLRPALVGIGAGILGLAPPYFIGLLVDSVIPEAAHNQLVQLALVLAVVSIATTAFNVVRNLSAQRLEIKMGGAVQPAMWDRLLGLPVSFFRRYTAGDLAHRVGAVDTIRRMLSGSAMSTIMTGLFSVFLFAQLFYYSSTLALIATVLVAIYVAATALVAYLQLHIRRASMEVEGRLSGLVLQLLSGIAKLRVTGAESRAFAEWAHGFAQQKRLDLRAGNITRALQVFTSAFPVASSMVLFYVVFSLPAAGAGGEGAMSVGQFIAFQTAFAMFLGQMVALGGTLISLLEIVPLFERARPLLESVPEVDVSKVDPGELTGQIDVEHVTFRYREDGPIILKDVSLSIAPRQFVAVVGPSGSGKSTLLRVLLGLDVPESGSVYYDRRDLALLDVQKLRSRVGVVMQTGRLRAGSIFENIVGSLPLTHDDAWEAARMAGFEADIREMPMGMFTVLQQGGTTLSGGQRQRLMIARAIVNRPSILLFDEATSALDNRTQAIVTESLQHLQATRVVIAHRLSTIVGADRIYVMAAGRVVQAGTYDELSREDGLFADLTRRQVA